MLYNGFVYLAKSDTGHYKIGRSKNPFARIKHFDTIMPVKVQIVHFFPCDNPAGAEKFLHYHYRHYRQTGEWFNFEEPAEFTICRILYYLNGEFVFKEHAGQEWMNSCCLYAIREAVGRELIIDMDDFGGDRWVQIQGKSINLKEEMQELMTDYGTGNNNGKQVLD